MTIPRRTVPIVLVVLAAAPTGGFAEDTVGAPLVGAAADVSRETRAPRVGRVRADAPRWFEASAVEAAWKGAMAASVVLDDRVAVIGVVDGEGGSVAQLDPATGRTLRARELGPDCRGAAAPGAAYLVALCDHDVVAIDPVTLAERWRREVGGNPGHLSAQADLLLVTFDRPPDPELGAVTGLVAFEASGRERWHALVPTSRGVGLAEDANRVYAWEGDPTVWAFDRVTGAMVWAAPMEPNIRDVAALGDGTVAVAREGGVVRYDAQGHEGAMIVERDVVALAARGTWLYTVENIDDEFRAGRLHGRDVATGRSWTYARPVGGGPLTLGDGVIYACTSTGTLHAVDAETGVGRWWADGVRECNLAVAGDAVLAGDWRGTIVVRDTPSRAPRVTIRGTFEDGNGGYGVRGHRVWVGDQMVRTDRRGRFRATVRRGPRVSITVDPRDVQPVDGTTLVPGDSLDVHVASYYEDCH